MSGNQAEVDSYVVASKRYSSFSPFASIRSTLNLGGKQFYGSYERPPYPIIVDTPTLRDVFTNLKFGDFVLFGSIYTTGIVWSYVISRPFTQIM
jgi:hypothetical protein